MNPWTVKRVAARFEACVETLKKLPRAESLGYTNLWPDIAYEPRELARQEPRSIRVLATPREVSCMEETLSWIVWVPQAHRKVIWLRAHGYSWRAIARETGFPKTSAQRLWETDLIALAWRLGKMRVNVR